MSKTLVFGDLQVHPFAEWSKPTGRGKTPLLELCEETFAWLKTLQAEYSCKNVIFLGDLFQHGDMIDAMSFDLVVEWMPQLARIDGHAIALIGNHDIYSKHADIHLMRWLELAGWQVVSEPSVLVFDDDYPAAQFEPYRKYDPMRMPHWASPHKRTLLFGHFDVKGAPLRPGFREKDGADLSDLSSFIGHYHHPDVMPTSRDMKHWAVFVGAPFHRNWSDVRTENPRGAVILESGRARDGDPQIQWKWVENPHSPFFETVDVTGEERISVAEALETFAQSYDAPERTHLRVFVRQGDEEIARMATKSFKSVRIIPSRHGAVSTSARHLLPAVELAPEKILTDAVLRDKVTKLEKKKLLEVGSGLLSVAKEEK